jgi:hypothetical protein
VFVSSGAAQVASMVGVCAVLIACTNEQGGRKGDTMNNGDAVATETPSLWLLEGKVPAPQSRAVVDYAAKTINIYILVVGADAENELDALYRRTGPADAGRVSFVHDKTSPAFSYLPLQLGDIRGFSTRIHLYGFSADHRLGTGVEDTARKVGAIIVAQGPSTDKENALRAVRVAGAQVQVAVLGEQEFGATCAQVSGRALIFQAPSTDHGFMDAIKVIAKDSLSKLRSDPSSTPTSPSTQKPWWKIW